MTSRQSVFEELIKETRDFVDRMAANENAFGMCSAVARYGVAFEPEEIGPDWLQLGMPRNCFNNAARYAAVRDDA